MNMIHLASARWTSLWLLGISYSIFTRHSWCIVKSLELCHNKPFFQIHYVLRQLFAKLLLLKSPAVQIGLPQGHRKTKNTAMQYSLTAALQFPLVAIQHNTYVDSDAIYTSLLTDQVIQLEYTKILSKFKREPEYVMLLKWFYASCCTRLFWVLWKSTGVCFCIIFHLWSPHFTRKTLLKHHRIWKKCFFF